MQLSWCIHQWIKNLQGIPAIFNPETENSYPIGHHLQNKHTDPLSFKMGYWLIPGDIKMQRRGGILTNGKRRRHIKVPPTDLFITGQGRILSKAQGHLADSEYRRQHAFRTLPAHFAAGERHIPLYIRGFYHRTTGREAHSRHNKSLSPQHGTWGRGHPHFIWKHKRDCVMYWLILYWLTDGWIYCWLLGEWMELI